MSTQKPREVEPYGEEYNGHYIGSAVKPIDKKNSISGHEWTEYEVLKTFSVHVLEKSPTPTRPMPGWPRRQFHSVKAAQREVDDQIALSLEVAKLSHKNSDQPDGTHYEHTWRKRVLTDLAEAAKGAIPALLEAKNSNKADPGVA